LRGSPGGMVNSFISMFSTELASADMVPRFEFLMMATSRRHHVCVSTPPHTNSPSPPSSPLLVSRSPAVAVGFVGSRAQALLPYITAPSLPLFLFFMTPLRLQNPRKVTVDRMVVGLRCWDSEATFVVPLRLELVVPLDNRTTQ
jgi:hypothetical protein